MVTEKDLIHTIALCHLHRNYLRRARERIHQYGSATEVWSHIDEPGMAEAMHCAEDEMNFILQHNIQTYYYGEDSYPYRLRECPDAPILLYGKGNIRTNTEHVVSVVGTRTASERGKNFTRELVMELGRALPEVTIVSGLAYGIDVAAHRAALEADIPTIIVPAHGLDRIYPDLHRDVAVRSLTKGGLLTEYPSKTEPERQNFVARDRIIAGLADAVVVVESRQKGGSLITARMAFDYDREVFARPGRPEDDSSRGCNNLIRSFRARLIESADDIIKAMNWDIEARPAIQTEIVELFESLTNEERTLLDKLRLAEDGLHINCMVMETNLPYSTVSSTLMMMEMKGLVCALPGGMYQARK